MTQRFHISDMQETETAGALTKLHPDHIKVSRIVALIWAFIPTLLALAIEAAQLFGEERILPAGSFLIPILLLLVFLVIMLPVRRYNHRGYDMGADRIRIVRGYLFHSDSIVPFGRIQHIDVDQGPIQRRYNLATLTVHTAGNHNSTVSLPGLLHEDAIAMREEIRAHIKREAL
ncbi:MAG: PH domain-containing protein [Sphingorhabdus sp.]